MESLIKQTSFLLSITANHFFRARFSDAVKENKEESSSTRDRKIPPQKTQSFREKKRSGSWIKRQFSRQTSVGRDFSGDEYPAAIAAAALAIQSLEEPRTRDQKKTTRGPDTSLARMKSKAEDKGNLSEGSEKFSDCLSDETCSMTSSKGTDMKASISTSASKKITEKEVGTAPSIKKKPTFGYTDPNNVIIDNQLTEKASPLKASAEPVPSMGSHPTSADKQLSITGSETPETTTRILDRPPTMAHQVETKMQIIPTKPGPGDTKPDAWEKAEMARIKERYEKLIATIQNWETKKKKKAKRKLESIQVKLDKKKAKAMQEYLSDMGRIEEIAERATTQAQKNRRNEELKVTEKASKFRSTGKLPATCLCF